MAAEDITLRVIYEYRLCLQSSTEKSDLSHSLHVLWHWRILSLWALFMQEIDSCNRYLNILASHYRTLKPTLWNCIILISSMQHNIWLTMVKGWASKKAGWLNVKQNSLKYYELCSTTVLMKVRKNWWLWFFISYPLGSLSSHKIKHDCSFDHSIAQG